MGTVHENIHTLVISCWILFRMRNFSFRRCRENQTAHFVFNNFIQKSHHVWNNLEKYHTGRQVTDVMIWHIHFACWITMARTQTHIQNMYCLSTATSYMNVPQYYVTRTLPVLVCWSLITRIAADNTKIKLQAVAPCAVRTAICVSFHFI